MYNSATWQQNLFISLINILRAIKSVCVLLLCGDSEV